MIDFTFRANPAAAESPEYGRLLIEPVTTKGRAALAEMCGPMAVSFGTDDLAATAKALTAHGCRLASVEVARWLKGCPVLTVEA